MHNLLWLLAEKLHTSESTYRKILVPYCLSPLSYKENLVARFM